MLTLYRYPNHEIPSGDVFTQRASAGSEAPISNVGGTRHTAATEPRSTTPRSPSLAPAR